MRIQLLAVGVTLGASLLTAQEYEVVERGPHHAVWRKEIEEVGPDGHTHIRTHSFTELATGLNWWSEQEGQWNPTVEEVTLVNGVAIADRAPHQVAFPASVLGWIDLLTPEGKRLRTQFLGLIYTDTATGQSVPLAVVKDRAGTVLPPNQVFYVDALDTDGGFRVDVRYTFTRAGLTQDILLRGAPPVPEAYGLSSETTVIEAITEWLDPPAPAVHTFLVRSESDPVKRQGLWEPDRFDQHLDFGIMKVGPGYAFVVGETTPQVTVEKNWLQVQGRRYLAERVDYTALEPLLGQLPQAGAANPGLRKNVRNLVELFQPREPGSEVEQMMLAANIPNFPETGRSVVLDYSILSSQSEHVFRGDTTYYLSNGIVNLSGLTTFEGGATLKFGTNGGSPKLAINGPVQFQTTATRPFILTGRDDDSCGEVLPDSTGDPSGKFYATVAMELNYATNLFELRNLQIRYAATALTAGYGGPTVKVRNAQICFVTNALANGTGGHFSLYNALLYRGTNVTVSWMTSTNRFEHVTIHGFDKFRGVSGTNYMTNSLLISVSSNVHYTGDKVGQSSSDSGIFTTLGEGAHYLPEGSPYRDTGTLAIDAELARELTARTTSAPLLLTNRISVPVTLYPQVARDLDTPDLGWHYPSLDVIADGTVITNATLSLAGGLAVGVKGNFGFHIQTGGMLVSEGMPTTLNQIVHYAAVQEHANTNWTTGVAPKSVQVTTTASQQPGAWFGHTGWSCLGGAGYHFYASLGGTINTPIGFKDCQFGPGNIFVKRLAQGLTNNLFERVSFVVEEPSTAPDHFFYNNLFYYGSLNLEANDTDNWFLYDNLFFGSDIFTTGSQINHDYNGYITSHDRLTPNSTNDVVLTNTPVFLTGSMGRFYYPTNDGMLSTLIDAGSVSNAATVGFQFLTTTTNQVQEGRSPLDIGFHYQPVQTPWVYAGEDQTNHFAVLNGQISSNVRGKVFVANDEWTLWDFGFTNDPSSDAGQFVTNLIAWFTGGQKANVLVNARAWQSGSLIGEGSFYAAITNAGHSVTITNSGAISFDFLAPYDAVFMTGDFTNDFAGQGERGAGWAPVLSAYRESGGGLYLCGGTLYAGTSEVDLTAYNLWNPFLASVGLAFDPFYNGIDSRSEDVSNIDSPHPLFSGVQRLVHVNGNSVNKLDAADPATAIPQTYRGHGLFGIHEPVVPLAWAKASGPGEVTFGDSNALKTWATFSQKGTYVLRLRARNGTLIGEDTVTIVVTNLPPEVTMTAPTNGATFAEVTNVTLTAQAQDDTWITNLSFFGPTELLGGLSGGTGGSYSIVWSNRMAGNYALLARATDNEGATTESDPVAFSVTTTNTAPTVTVTFPTNNALFSAGADLTIAATASDSDPGGIVTNVSFYVNGLLIGHDAETPYSLRLCCLEPGVYEFTARAFDNLGLAGVSAPVTNVVAEAFLPRTEGFWDPVFGLPGVTVLSSVQALAIDENRNLYAGGDFAEIDGHNAKGIARWDGTNWTNLGSGLEVSNDPSAPTERVFTILITNTTVIAGGGFLASGGGDQSVKYVAQWDGSSWSRLGSNELNGVVRTIAMVGSDIYIGGDFANDSAAYVAKLQSGGWVSVGNGLNAPVYALASIGNRLYAGGAFTSAGGNTNVKYLTRLEGSNWTDLNAALAGTNQTHGTVRALAVCGQTLFLGGDFTSAGGLTNANGLAQWDGTKWSIFGDGVSGGLGGTNDPTSPAAPSVYSITPAGQELFVGGEFTHAHYGTNSVVVNYIARITWNELDQTWVWSDLERGVSDLEAGANHVFATALRRGESTNAFELFVGGCFYKAGRRPSLNIARWAVGYPEPIVTDPPTATIISPTNLTVLNDPVTIWVTNFASIASGNLSRLELYIDGLPRYTNLLSAPSVTWSVSWQTNTSGLYLLELVAFGGAFGEEKATVSDPVWIVVPDSVIEHPPGEGPSLPAPSAVRDNYVAAMNGTPLVLNVLTNDVSATNATLRISRFGTARAPKGSVQISATGKQLIYAPPVNLAGVDGFDYTVTDASGGQDSTLVTVRLQAPPAAELPFTPLSVRLAQSNALNIQVYGSDIDGAVTNLQVYVNNEPQWTTTNSIFQTNYVFSTPGFYSIYARAADNDGLTGDSALHRVQVTNAVGGALPPEGFISSPMDKEEENSYGLWVGHRALIREPVFTLRGLARDVDSADDSFRVLLYEPGGKEPIANVTAGPLDSMGFHPGNDTNASLGTIDLSGVRNGPYDLYLTVRGGGQETNPPPVHIILESGLKIGHFSFNVEDLVIPVSGIPLTVVRSYSSLNPAGSDDFGPGWTMAVNDMDVQLDEIRDEVDDILALDENDLDDYFGFWRLPKPDFSIRVGGPRNVTLTLPDGRRTTFLYTPRLQSDEAYAEWTAPPGIHATLEIDNPLINYIPFPHWKADANLNYENYDSPRFTLRTRDGTTYQLDRPVEYNGGLVNFGDGDYREFDQTYGRPKLSRITQRTGDRIDINSEGTAHYLAGETNATRSIRFERDPNRGRIVAIYDPVSGTNGLPVLRYEYHTHSGNLFRVHRLENRTAGSYLTTTYRYENSNFPHYITSIDDPRGIEVARNFYGANGRLERSVDADGKETRFIHNLTNRLELVADRLGNTNSYAYDPRGNVTTITNAAGEVMLMAYNIQDNLTQQVQVVSASLSLVTRYQFDTNGLLLAGVNPLGHTNGFGYGNFDLPLYSVDPLGHGVTNGYDANGNLTSITNALGQPTRMLYDSKSLLISQTDALLNVTTNRYDESGNLTNVTVLSPSGAIQSVMAYVYDENGNRTQELARRTLVNGNVTWQTTVYTYDALNRVVKTVNPASGTNQTVYNEIGKVAQTIDALNRTTTFEYDARGLLIRQTYPDTNYESFAYDAEARRIAATNRLGQPTQYAYDALGRLRITTYPDGSTNCTFYDGAGRVQFTIDARGTTTAFGYDNAGRRTAVTNAYPSTDFLTQYAFDAAGNLTNILDAESRSTGYQYDALNRRVKTVFPITESGGSNATIQTAYDALGRRVAETNEAGVVRLFGYDALSRLTEIVSAYGVSEVTTNRYSYDEVGDQTNQVDALGRVTTFHSDALGRRIGRSLPGGQAEGFGYDAVGNQLTHTNFNSQVITGEYDLLNRLSKRWAGTNLLESYQYDAEGRLTNRIDASGPHTWVYDLRGRVLSNSSPVGTLSYAYDTNGNLTTLASGTSNGVSVAYQYDVLNRLTNVIDNRLTGTKNTAYTFDKVGNLKALKYPNGVTNLWQYDARNHLTNALSKLNTSEWAKFFYKLDVAGHRTNFISSVTLGGTRTNAWTYDRLYRLTNETITGTSAGTVSYVYDPAGNRLSRTSTLNGVATTNNWFDANDWLDKDGVPTNSSAWFDANGNTRTNHTAIYFYDWANRLTNGPTVTNIVYDALGNRIKKVAAATTTLYLVDHLNPTGYPQVLEEIRTTSTTSNLLVYTYGLDLISQRQTNSPATNFFGYDGLGSTRFLVNSAGNVAQTCAYDAFGNLIASNATPITAYLFAGEQWDPDLGLYYNRARYWSPNVGRFWTMDSFEGNLSDPLSLHKYLYAHGDPVNGTDPSGYENIASVSVAMSESFALRNRDLQAKAPYSGAARVATQFQRALVRPPTVLNPAPYAPQIANSPIAKGVAWALLAIIAAGQTAQILDAVIADDTLTDDDAFVVRGGVATAGQLQGGVDRHREVTGLIGFSVQSEPGKSVDELARGGRLPHNQISVSSTKTIRAAGIAMGYDVQVVKSPGRGDYHATVTSPLPMPDDLARALSLTFTPMPNPHRFR